MKIFIIGQMEGVPGDELQVKFGNAASLLESLSLEAVNPLDMEIPEGATFAQRVGRLVEALLCSDGALMLDNWRQSSECGILRAVARKMQMPVLYEEIELDKESRMIAEMVEDAVSQVTGLSLKQFSEKSRCRERCYARMIFVYHCRRLKMRLVQISRFVRRDHTTMLHYLHKYNDEMEYNKEFCELATKCAQIIKEHEICIEKPKEN